MSRRPRFYHITEDCLDRNVDRRSPALILVSDKGSLKKSFRSLSLEAGRWVTFFRDHQCRVGNRVILALGDAQAFVGAFFGAMKLGVIPIPVSPLLTARELRFIVKDSGAKQVLKKVPASLNSLVPFSSVISAKANQPAFWLYTSGTEGRPKAVIHAHRSLPSHDARVRLWMDLKAHDVVFNTSALHWSYALTCGLMDVWRKGATSVVYQGELTAEKLAQVVCKQRVTVFMSVPGLYRRLCLSHIDLRQIFKKVRVCLSAGEKLSPEIRELFFKKTGKRIYEGLGMTEHSVYLVQRFGKLLVKGASGQALPGHRIAVLNTKGHPARVNEVGVLASHKTCPGLMLGYHRRPQETHKAFRGDWFVSGDLAYRDARGNFFYVGRNDDMITAGGFRISPLEVEKVLNGLPEVQESAVVGLEKDGKTLLTAFVIPGKKPQKKKENWEETIRKKVAKLLVPHKVPRQIIAVDSLPKTNNGKLKRAALRLRK